ncbi:diaminopimelate epimerase [Candidatus Bipolaricaulota bacterium]|nr:diaminopimelate epimerase [Candidatus Bipolaricaulota bacterium]
MKFTKMQGLGNEFIVIEDPGERYNLSSEVVAKLCDRHFGIGGGGGLMIVERSQQADFRMRYFSINGTEAEICGNGIRCFARYVYDHRLTPERNFLIETLAGIREAWLLPESGPVKEVKINMGAPIFSRSSIPMLGEGEEAVDEVLRVGEEEFRATSLSMGNPHCIIYLDDVKRAPVNQVGPIIENLPIFPQKVNVEFVEILNSSEIKMRMWERNGEGEPLSCGSGSCACVAATVRTKRTGRKVIVHQPGAGLEIEWNNENGCIYMTGPAEEIFTGSLSRRFEEAIGLISKEGTNVDE